jgi:hypothetical protein
MAVQYKTAAATQTRTWILVGIMNKLDLLLAFRDQPYAFSWLECLLPACRAEEQVLFRDRNPC